MQHARIWHALPSPSLPRVDTHAIRLREQLTVRLCAAVCGCVWYGVATLRPEGSHHTYSKNKQHHTPPPPPPPPSRTDMGHPLGAPRRLIFAHLKMKGKARPVVALTPSPSKAETSYKQREPLPLPDTNSSTCPCPNQAGVRRQYLPERQIDTRTGPCSRKLTKLWKIPPAAPTQHNDNSLTQHKP